MAEKGAKDIAKERWNTEFLQRANDEMVYLQMAVKKRFFNQQDIEKFWQAWQLLFYKEENMTRYALNKVLWRCSAKKLVSGKIQGEKL